MIKTPIKKSILICGIGAIGSFLAEILVRCIDNAQIIFIDSDRVEIKNLLNQNYTYNDIGSTKTTALYKRIFGITSPNITISALSYYVDLGNVYRLITSTQPDLVIDCFDNTESRLLINKTCIQQNVPCLHIGMSNVHAGVRWGSDNYKVIDVDDEDVCDRGAANSLTKIIRTSVMGVESIAEYLETGNQENRMMFF